MTASPDIALIIGSGFESLVGEGEEQHAETRFGSPSAPVRRLLLEGCPLLSIARHGERHSIPPHAINYRANLVALRDAGARSIVALNTVGAVSAVRDPGEIAIPEQLIDYTWGRAHTVFDGSDDVVEHIDFTEPFSRGLRQALLAAAAGLDCFDGGVYAATQGPRLETAAEVDRLEREGVDYVGMTAMPEAAIARELGMDYACVAMIVNRAAGRGDLPIHDDVEASTESARKVTMRLLREYCRQRAGRTG